MEVPARVVPFEDGCPSNSTRPPGQQTRAGRPRGDGGGPRRSPASAPRLPPADLLRDAAGPGPSRASCRGWATSILSPPATSSGRRKRRTGDPSVRKATGLGLVGAEGEAGARLAANAGAVPACAALVGRERTGDCARQGHDDRLPRDDCSNGAGADELERHARRTGAAFGRRPSVSLASWATATPRSSRRPPTSSDVRRVLRESTYPHGNFVTRRLRRMLGPTRGRPTSPCDTFARSAIRSALACDLEGLSRVVTNPEKEGRSWLRHPSSTSSPRRLIG